ncbi:Cyclic nucleotide-gated channel subunit beta 1 [Balamuthia mandrillaris]
MTVTLTLPMLLVMIVAVDDDKEEGTDDDHCYPDKAEAADANKDEEEKKEKEEKEEEEKEEEEEEKEEEEAHDGEAEVDDSEKEDPEWSQVLTQPMLNFSYEEERRLDKEWNSCRVSQADQSNLHQPNHNGKPKATTGKTKVPPATGIKAPRKNNKAKPSINNKAAYKHKPLTSPASTTYVKKKTQGHYGMSPLLPWKEDVSNHFSSAPPGSKRTWRPNPWYQNEELIVPPKPAQHARKTSSTISISSSVSNSISPSSHFSASPNPSPPLPLPPPQATHTASSPLQVAATTTPTANSTSTVPVVSQRQPRRLARRKRQQQKHVPLQNKFTLHPFLLGDRHHQLAVTPDLSSFNARKNFRNSKNSCQNLYLPLKLLQKYLCCQIVDLNIGSCTFSLNSSVG